MIHFTRDAEEKRKQKEAALLLNKPVNQVELKLNSLFTADEVDDED